jgi:succinyl-diaminopimelate desuccinylase
MNSIIDLTTELVKIPSQAGIDDCEVILNYIHNWSVENRLNVRYLYDDNDKRVAVLVQVNGKQNGKRYCFDACVDTAPFGEKIKWKYGPTSGKIKNGYMYGRGSSDSKVATSIFLHMAKELKEINFNGQIDFLFDADEHTGNFSGVKSYVNYLNGEKIHGVFIGYPGNDEIVIGARGFYRVEVTLYGDMMHSGSRKKNKSNSIIKASKLIKMISEYKFDNNKNKLFYFGPKITVTKINGGDGFAVTPSKCILNIDVRLTPSFNSKSAKNLINKFISSIDNDCPLNFKSKVEELSFEEAYNINENEYFINILKENAEKIFSKKINFSVCGPSNIGNFLYKYGINATCGFGVDYERMHSIDERINLESVKNVYETYFETIKSLII